MANISNQWCATKLNDFLKSTFKIESEDFPTDASSLYSWLNWPEGKGGKYFTSIANPKLLYKGDIIIRDTAQDYIAIVYEGGSVSGKYKIAEGNSVLKKFIKKQTTGPVAYVLRARGAKSDVAATYPDVASTFKTWFDEQGFKRFSASDFTGYFARSLNAEPPKQLWNNIVPTLRIVEELCDSFGQTCNINSSYRSKAYNAKVGGESNSLHMAFKALDISFPGVSPRTVSARLKKWRADGKFAGGIGTYPTFVHVDTRGYNATW